MKSFASFRGTRRAGQSGQIAIAVPILVLFLTLMFFISRDISVMVHEKIKLQTSLDSAARAGARTQSMALGTVTLLNDCIITGQIILARAGVEVFDPETWPAALEDGIHGVQIITKSQNIQDKIVNCELVPICVVAAVFGEGMQNSSDTYAFALPIAAYIPKVGGFVSLNIQVERNWTMCMVRNDMITGIGEFVGVVAFKTSSSGQPWTGRLFGQDLSYPDMWALGAAMPYYTGLFGSHDPLDDVLNPAEQFVSMRIPGPLWDSKLCDLWADTEADVASEFLELGFSNIAQSLTSQLSKSLSDKIFADQESSCFSSPESGVSDLGEESADIEMTTVTDFDE